ncbi:MAG TPA: phage holin family protein [Verrucomicrobiae bacterium]|jgi:putative membrane protein|nr:phage holin family protein [Verrucomicrobiae bacterium]
MISFLKRWLILALAVVLAASVVPGIEYRPLGLLAATLLLSILNAVVRPIIVLLSLPLLIFTLGLFMLVINALLLWGVGHIINGFQVNTFASAFWGALIISVASLVLNSLTRSGDSRVHFSRGKPPGPRPPPDGGGPVIDI